VCARARACVVPVVVCVFVCGCVVCGVRKWVCVSCVYVCVGGCIVLHQDKHKFVENIKKKIVSQFLIFVLCNLGLQYFNASIINF